MKKIGIISDTHHSFDDKIHEFLKDTDQIWHAGDIGKIEIADQINAFKPMTGVFGNIDDNIVRITYPKYQYFICEGMSVLMTHIGGHPGRYESEALSKIRELRPNIFISGHSHILKVIYDQKYDLMHINPGAAGFYGFHNVRTAIRMTIDQGRITELEIGEWERVK